MLPPDSFVVILTGPIPFRPVALAVMYMVASSEGVGFVRAFVGEEKRLFRDP